MGELERICHNPWVVHASYVYTNVFAFCSLNNGIKYFADHSSWNPPRLCKGVAATLLCIACLFFISGHLCVGSIVHISVYVFLFLFWEVFSQIILSLLIKTVTQKTLWRVQKKRTQIWQSAAKMSLFFLCRLSFFLIRKTVYKYHYLKHASSEEAPKYISEVPSLFTTVALLAAFDIRTAVYRPNNY